jgi:AcrR family transcriptional regulator
VRERILDAFAARARSSGIRGVVMGELATDLGISKKTLYQHFESKQDLVQALLARWGNEIRAREARLAAGAVTPIEVLHRMGERWLNAVGNFAPAFWQELRRDHPEAHEIFRTTAREARLRGREEISRMLRPGVPPSLAFDLIQAVFARAADPAVCERAGLARSDALKAAVDLWAHGALQEPSPRTRKRRVAGRSS